tara:strand:+ start:24 stop:485 length:462 start_codon:yes stop_codon:yes gene_type:complete
MAFKMKAGKEGPMKKNFGKDVSPMNKPLVGNQKNLPDHLKQKILDSPVKLKVGRADGKKLKDKIKDITKKVADVNQGVGGSIKKKDSPKKFLGKALGGGLGKVLGGGLGKVVGKVGKFAKKNPALAGMALGGPLGGLAGGVIGAMKMVKKKRK